MAQFLTRALFVSLQKDVGLHYPSNLRCICAISCCDDNEIRAWTEIANGKYVLTGGNDRTVRLHNPIRIDPGYSDVDGDSVPPALLIQTYFDGLNHPVSAVAVDPQSTTLACASDRTVVVTDVVTKRVKRRLHGHYGRINSVACSANAETILSASYDGKVMIFDGRSWNADPIQVLDEASDSVSCVTVSDSEIVTASVDGVVRYYDLRMGELRSDNVGDPITGLDLSQDGFCVAVTCLDGTIRLIERKSGELLNTYSGAHKAGNYGLEIAFTADGSHVVSGSEDGSVILYDVMSGKSSSLKGHSRPTCAVAAHPNREQTSVVISASYDGNALVWANPAHVSRWDRS